MLLRLPEIMIALHRKPTLRRMREGLRETQRHFRANTAGTLQNTI